MRALAIIYCVVLWTLVFTAPMAALFMLSTTVCLALLYLLLEGTKNVRSNY
jgi:hypothetical protein